MISYLIENHILRYAYSIPPTKHSLNVNKQKQIPKV